MYDVTWEGHHYRRSDPSGARGTVTFSNKGVVAIFFEPQCPGAPAPGARPLGARARALPPQKKLDDHFKGIPSALMQLARRETLATMDDGDGPLVTAAFWSTPAGELTGARPWPRLFEGGAHLVQLELGKPDAAVAAWAERYALDAEQANAIQAAFPTKGTVPPASARVTLGEAARAALRLLPNQPTRELLEGAGIVLG
jgi:hypothetical protein